MSITIEALSAATGRFAAELALADPTAVVPSCPGWTVAELAHHLGDVHSWSRDAVRRGGAAPGPGEVRAPEGDLAGWYATRADALVAALAEAGDDAPAWVFAPTAGVGTAGFWLRRQVHETVLHTWDLLAAGGVSDALDPELAWDGVAEVRDAFYPRQVALGRTPALPVALELHPTDLDRSPVVLGEGEPVTVRGPAAELLLRVWHRSDAAPTGEDPRVGVLLAQALVP